MSQFNQMLGAARGSGRPDTQQPFRPKEALGVVDAVDTFTAGVARVSGVKLLGALTPGRRAALLDQDLFTIPRRDRRYLRGAGAATSAPHRQPSCR
jgi:predicted amidohydrolase YtcJ